MTTDDDPQVSIIIPAYNAEKWLKSCLDSVINQKVNFPFEIIVINDGSTDGTSNILTEYSNAYSHLKVLNQNNQGVSAARNLGIKEAKGKWITFVDADDELVPDALQIMTRMIGDSEVAVLGVALFTTDAEKQMILSQRQSFKPKVKGWSAGEQVCETMLYKSGLLPSPCGKIFKKELLKNNLFAEGTRYEDVEWSSRAYLSVKSVKYFPGCMVYLYRDNPASFLNNFTPNRLDVLKVTRKIEERFRQNKRLYRAARNRRFAANFNILLTLHLLKNPEYKEMEADCYKLIKAYRREVIFSSHSRMKVRIGAITSYGGKGLMKQLAKYYKGR